MWVCIYFLAAWFFSWVVVSWFGLFCFGKFLEAGGFGGKVGEVGEEGSGLGFREAGSGYWD